MSVMALAERCYHIIKGWLAKAGNFVASTLLNLACSRKERDLNPFSAKLELIGQLRDAHGAQNHQKRNKRQAVLGRKSPRGVVNIGRHIQRYTEATTWNRWKHQQVHKPLTLNPTQ